MNTIEPTEVTFPFSFRYELSEAGQRNHLLSGGDGRQSQRVEGQISLASAEALGYKFRNGGLTEIAQELRTGQRHSYRNEFILASYDGALTFEQALADALKFRPQHLEWLATEKATKQAAKEAALTGQVDASTRGSRIEVRHNGRLFYFENDPELIEMIRARQVEQERIQAEAKANREAEDAAREHGKQDQIAEWLGQRGSDDQRERWAANLFPTDEAVKAMKESAFAPGDDLDVYDRITKSEIDHSEGCPSQWDDDDDWDMDCAVADAATVTPEEWARLKVIKALFPSATEVAIKRHTCTCDRDACTAEVERSGVYVKLLVGSFVFNREFAL